MILACTMKFEVLSVRAPAWSDPERTQIDCIVRFAIYANELPFTARADDVEEHGRQIFERCVRGEFGEISPYLKSESQVTNVPTDVQPNWIAAWPEVHNFLVEANLENSGQSARGIGLVWGSMLEVMLTKFAEVELKRLGRGKHSLKCATGAKCSSDFNGWIEGAVNEKFIDCSLGRHLHAVRRIRNSCAHEWQFSFENPRVGELRKDFTILKEAYSPDYLGEDLELLMKIVFSSSCSVIIIYLAGRTA